MTVLNLDRVERKQFYTHLADRIADGIIGGNRDECWDSLVAAFGERYGFDESDLNSEFEGIIDEAIECCSRHSRHIDEAVERGIDWL